MKILKQIFLTAVIVIGSSIAASAQDKDQKQRPPKNPPVIVPGDKDKEKPKESKPKNDDQNKNNRGKKPQIVLIKASDSIKIEFA